MLHLGADVQARLLIGTDDKAHEVDVPGARLTGPQDGWRVRVYGI